MQYRQMQFEWVNQVGLRKKKGKENEKLTSDRMHPWMQVRAVYCVTHLGGLGRT